MIPKVHPGLDLDVDDDLEVGQMIGHQIFQPLLCLGTQILRVEVHKVVIPDALSRLEAVTQVQTIWATPPAPKYQSGSPNSQATFSTR